MMVQQLETSKEYIGLGDVLCFADQALEPKFMRSPES